MRVLNVAFGPNSVHVTQIPKTAYFQGARMINGTYEVFYSFDDSGAVAAENVEFKTVDGNESYPATYQYVAMVENPQNLVVTHVICKRQGGQATQLPA